MERCWALLVPRRQAKAVREACKRRDYNDTRRKVVAVDSALLRLLRSTRPSGEEDAAPRSGKDAQGDAGQCDDEEHMALPLNDSAAGFFHGLLAQADGQQRLWSHLDLSSLTSTPPFRLWLHFARCPSLSSALNPHQQLPRSIRDFCQSRGLSMPPSLLSALPQRWEQLDDLLLLPADAFTSPAWTAWLSSLSPSLLSSFYAAVAAAFRCRRLGRQQPVQAGLKRRSAVQLLLGDDGRVEHRENGVVFAFDVRLSMFSSGNGTEKQRMIRLVNAALQQPRPSSRPYVVLDLYAGLGYFSLPLLVHTAVAHVHCCEFNADTFAALQASLARNGVDPRRVSLHPGDNRRAELRRALRGSVDRALLGLLPSSEDGYQTALSSLKDEGGWLHIHANVHCEQRREWVDGTLHRLSALLECDDDARRRRWAVREEGVERVKTFAPFIDHLVLDVRLIPAVEPALPASPPAALPTLSSALSQPSAETLASIGSLTPAPSSPFSYRTDGVAVHAKPTSADFFSSIHPRAAPALLTGLDVGDLADFTPPALLALPPASCPSVTVHVCPLASGRMDFTCKASYTFRVLPFHGLIRRLVASHSASPPSDVSASLDPLRDEYFVSKSERYYLRALGADPRREPADFFSSFPALASKLRLPFDLAPSVTPHSSVLRVSSPGLSLWTHYDVVDNVLIHLHGVKRVTLFPPDQCANLHLPAAPHSSSSPVVDLYTPDLHRFPRFATAQRVARQLLLHPGDVLFLPALWFHHVETVGDEVGVSVNVFWKQLPEEVYTAGDVYGNKDLKAGVAAMRSVEEAVKETESLPPVYQDFYLRRAQAVLEQALERGSLRSGSGST